MAAPTLLCNEEKPPRSNGNSTNLKRQTESQMNLSVGKLPRIGAVLAALMLALTLLACTQADEDQQADPFTIGVMESLTGPGETYGTVASQAKAHGCRRDQRRRRY